MVKNKNSQSFGGDWTREKLEILKGYLGSYSNALKRQSFKRIYIDAFSGTGYISVPRKKVGNEEQSSFDFAVSSDSKKAVDLALRLAKHWLKNHERFE